MVEITIFEAMSNCETEEESAREESQRKAEEERQCLASQTSALRAGGHRLFAQIDISLTVHTSECLLLLQMRPQQSVSLTSLRKTVSR